MGTGEEADDIMQCLKGFTAWMHTDGCKICADVWSKPFQGLESAVERYRNSPVMHESVDDKFKPMFFKEGQLVSFPPPTRKLRRPKEHTAFAIADLAPSTDSPMRGPPELQRG